MTVEQDRNTIRVGRWLIRWLPDDQQPQGEPQQGKWQAMNCQGRTIEDPALILAELLVAGRLRRGQS